MLRKLTAAALLSLGASLPAAAEISITVARIAEGDLWVVGQVEEAEREVTLEDRFSQTSDRRGRFQFRVVYHPATCIVTVKADGETRQAVVGNCGQVGPRGEAGLQGPPGPAGPPGPPGSAGTVAEADAPPRGADAPTPPPRPSDSPGREGSAQSEQRTARAAAPPAEPARPLAPPTNGAIPPNTQAYVSPQTVPDPPKPRPSSPMEGEWLVEDGTARIQIKPCGQTMCGNVVWSKEGGGVGTQVLHSMKTAGANKWEGSIFNPNNGKTYDSKVSLQGSNALRVEGCVMGFLCGGQTWTRVR